MIHNFLSLFTNSVITYTQSKYYGIVEPVKLAYQRAKYEKFYGPDEESPHIFVYTPTFNRGKILVERAVKTVLQQTYKNFTYLIVGDCCTDNTESLVREIADPRVQFFNIPTRSYRYPPTAKNHWLMGPSFASNVALSRVPPYAKFIATIDDDDFWEPEHLEKILRFTVIHNYEFATARTHFISEAKDIFNNEKKIYTPYYRLKPPSSEYYYNPLLGSRCTALYRSYLKCFKYNMHSWRKKHNKNNEIDLFLRMFLAGVRMGFLDEVTLKVTPRPGCERLGSAVYLEKEEAICDKYKFTAP